MVLKLSGIQTLLDFTSYIICWIKEEFSISWNDSVNIKANMAKLLGFKLIYEVVVNCFTKQILKKGSREKDGGFLGDGGDVVDGDLRILFFNLQL